MRLLTLLFALLLPFAATAQDSTPRPDTILVLDASGSMWGQIDGVNKIVIAREVVADLLADFPADQNLGLVAYGHNRRGDCADIETLVQPAPGTGPQIIDIVNSLNPRGMTPMTDAVIAAAESLRSTEQAATVILVSDGIETCNPDPCAAARVLEETGVDFTAHVIGFDVAGEAEALAQMQCLANETGGMFLTADNADELGAAMQTVMAEVTTKPAPAPTPEAVMAEVTLQAVAGSEAGVMVADPLVWRVEAAGGAVPVTGAEGNPLTLPLAIGSYTVTAENTAAGTVATTDFTIVGPDDATILVVFPDPVPAATLTAPASAPAGSMIEIGWTGPEDDLDTILIAPEGGDARSAYAYVETGNPVSIVVPGTPGAYEIHYMWRDQRPIATQKLTVTEATLALMAPDSAPGGSTIDVGWTGPNQELDNIQVGTVGGSDYLDYAYVTDGNPVQIILPWAPGEYELRYSLQDTEIILRRPITITPAEVSLTAPATGAAGTEIAVDWTGPAAEYDNIQVGSVGGQDYLDYAYVTDGNPVTLTLPGAAGDYELRYHFRDRETILRQPITVTAQTAALSVPGKLSVGQTVQIGWTGPGMEGDFIGIGRPGESYGTWAYTRDGNPATVTLPTEPGVWEVRYYLGSDGQTVLASQTITLAAATATLTAPASAITGQPVSVGWTGPGHDGDFVAIGRPGEGYGVWTYTSEGNPLTIAAPTEAGDWELRYYMAGSDQPLATVPLVVTGK